MPDSHRSSPESREDEVSVIEVDEVILPDDWQHSSSPESPPLPPEFRAVVSRFLAWLLDDAIRLPGTNIRFGLDPILGLIPGGGETLASLLGLYLLGDGARRGLPSRTILKMAGNMLLNAGVGAIPIFGDIFSLWFKSNARNYVLIREWMESHDGRERSGGWWPLALVLGTIGLILALNIAAWWLFLWLLGKIFGG